MPEAILVTGGCGFIGSHFIRHLLKNEPTLIINLDLLTYAGNRQLLHDLQDNRSHHFVQGDINDHALISNLLSKFHPKAIINFAAESHVDRSILQAEGFIQTNIMGTYRLLETTRAYWEALSPEKKKEFRFLQVSTDEVYGSLTPQDSPFTESTTLSPNSPYAASKAAADHLARAWFKSYGLPVIITHSSNNYGPWQYPEKLIPFMIQNALQNNPLPLYGDGQHSRDWIHVQDHCDALYRILMKGSVGSTYCIASETEYTNESVVRTICQILDELCPCGDNTSYSEKISYVSDRPGHDRRYAMSRKKIESELGWTPQCVFEQGLRETVTWYLSHQSWIQARQDESFARQILKTYAKWSQTA